jgi:hypothetical protein
MEFIRNLEAKIVDLSLLPNGDFCCNSMKTQWNANNIGTDSEDICIVYHDTDNPRVIRGYMDINYCPFCGEKIDIYK